jgi:predicted phosphodiesterase
MKIIRSDAELELVTLYPLGDWHLGSEHCDIKLINKQINEIKKDQTARIILMGDLAETATKESVGAGVYEQEQNAQQQMMRVKNLLYDVRHLIDGVVTGNHEERIYKTSGFDLSLYLCQMLEIENKYMRYQGIVAYVIGKRSYLVNVWHGSGGGGSAGASLNKLQKQSEYVLADIYLMGHVHKRQVHTKQMIIPNPRYEKKEIIMQYFVATGSSLDYENSYAESAGMTPSQKGFTKIKMWTERNRGEDKNERLKRIEIII